MSSTENLQNLLSSLQGMSQDQRGPLMQLMLQNSIAQRKQVMETEVPKIDQNMSGQYTNKQQPLLTNLLLQTLQSQDKKPEPVQKKSPTDLMQLFQDIRGTETKNSESSGTTQNHGSRDEESHPQDGQSQQLIDILGILKSKNASQTATNNVSSSLLSNMLRKQESVCAVGGQQPGHECVEQDGNNETLTNLQQLITKSRQQQQSFSSSQSKIQALLQKLNQGISNVQQVEQVESKTETTPIEQLLLQKIQSLSQSLNQNQNTHVQSLLNSKHNQGFGLNREQSKSNQSPPQTIRQFGSLTKSLGLLQTQNSNSPLQPLKSQVLAPPKQGLDITSSVPNVANNDHLAKILQNMVQQRATKCTESDNDPVNGQLKSLLSQLNASNAQLATVVKQDHQVMSYLQPTNNATTSLKLQNQNSIAAKFFGSDLSNFTQLMGENPEYHELKRTEIDREMIDDESVKQQIPADCSTVEVIQGSNVGGDLSRIKINQKESKHHIPSTRSFRIFKFKNPKTQRFLKILKCDFPGCPMNFRKWHNFYDHLRIHTKERPFICPFKNQLDCNLTFTQKSNLNKHVRSHLLKQPDLKPDSEMQPAQDSTTSVQAQTCTDRKNERIERVLDKHHQQKASELFGMKFQTNSLLKKFGPELPTKNYCETCDMSFKNIHYLNRHKQAYHPDEVKIHSECVNDDRKSITSGQENSTGHKKIQSVNSSIYQGELNDTNTVTLDAKPQTQGNLLEILQDLQKNGPPPANFDILAYLQNKQ